MIVRVQQFPIDQAEPLGGWPEQGPAGGIVYEWPAGTGAFEIVVAENDESGRRISAGVRRDHLRSVIPSLAETLKQSDEKLAARLDGPCAPGELFTAFSHLPQADTRGRFAISPVQKLDPEPSVVMGSIRIEMDFDRLEALCADPGLNLESSVRLRLFALPEELVNPFLDTSDTDDERWGEILGRTGFIIQPVGGMDSIQIITPRYGAGEFSARVTRALAGAVD